jgi:hypothetical protein
VVPSDGKTDEKLTDKPAEVSNEKEQKSEDNEDKGKEKKIQHCYSRRNHLMSSP